MSRLSSILRLGKYENDLFGLHNFKILRLCKQTTVLNSTQADPSHQEKVQEGENAVEKQRSTLNPNMRFMYPEFLPDPTMERRNPIKEKLERMDMLRRRAQIDIPVFYVGSIVAVTRSNEHAPDKFSRFLGICIERANSGLQAEFTLRNVIEGLGYEMKFFLYDPTIVKYEVLRLEKRLDDHLLYLRDALPEYCTFPLDMEPEFLPDGAEVPVNPVKVKLKPRPWCARWERSECKGLDMEVVDSYITEKMKAQRAKLVTPWEKYDLMKQYRKTIPEEEQNEIYAEVSSELHKQELTKKKMKKKREFIKPRKVG
ncbi:39S ribosomal protein L19, mitochondrial [Macrosteles quadrilineatus]|uniref:39S ribosomal protein L19, mitochondrial n=1 Tax=Macrosteles quadrilineatus TaxID=74068 RepID=UPI0023E29A51|nr:39S ribosomal protein L19, mitochondrial [Macrosteles quadrilineatus]